MNDKQKRFALEYVKDSNATAAAIRAGYSESNARQTGSRLKQDPRVNEIIEKLQAKAAEKALLDAQWVLEKWKTLAENCMQEVVAYSMTGAPVKDRSGEQAYKMLDANTARNVLSDIAKHLQMFEKPVEDKSEDTTSGVLLTAPVEEKEQWTKNE